MTPDNPELSDAQIDDVWDLTPTLETQTATRRHYARAIVAADRALRQAGQEPVAYRYKFAGDLQWQYTERKEQAHPNAVLELLFNESRPAGQAAISKYGSPELQDLILAKLARQQEPLTDAQCDESRRHPGDFNAMVRAIYDAGRAQGQAGKEAKP